MKIINTSALSFLLICTACDPVTIAVGGTAVVGATVARNQHGLGGTISDTELQAKINNRLLQKDKVLFDKIELSVKHGMVVAIGYVDDESQKQRAMQIIQNVEGSREVFDEIKIQKAPTASETAKDATITSRIKSSLLFDGNIASPNYDVTTVKGVVYICGTAKTKYERDVVLNHARTTSGVKNVVAYIKISKDEPK